MRNYSHGRDSNGGYGSSGPLMPPTRLGPDGIPRPTRGPQAGPVVGFNLRACLYGFCQCIYDMIVFVFCCGLCFWCVHVCCRKKDPYHDTNNNNNINNNNHKNRAYNKYDQQNNNYHKYGSTTTTNTTNTANTSSSTPNNANTGNTGNNPNNPNNSNNNQNVGINANEDNKGNPSNAGAAGGSYQSIPEDATAATSTGQSKTKEDVTISYQENNETAANEKNEFLI